MTQNRCARPRALAYASGPSTISTWCVSAHNELYLDPSLRLPKGVPLGHDGGRAASAGSNVRVMGGSGSRELLVRRNRMCHLRGACIGQLSNRRRGKKNSGVLSWTNRSRERMHCWVSMTAGICSDGKTSYETSSPLDCCRSSFEISSSADETMSFQEMKISESVLIYTAGERSSLEPQ